MVGAVPGRRALVQLPVGDHRAVRDRPGAGGRTHYPDDGRPPRLRVLITAQPREPRHAATQEERQRLGPRDRGHPRRAASGSTPTERPRRSLLGFNILRTGPGDEGFDRRSTSGRDFAGITSDVPVIQEFMWGDYRVEPATTYTYRDRAGDRDAGQAAQGRGASRSRSPPRTRRPGPTRCTSTGGSPAASPTAAGSATIRRFYKARPPRDRPGGASATRSSCDPQDVPDGAADLWLSRGLEEAMLEFIGQADGPQYSIRAALYELTHRPAIQAFVERAGDRGRRQDRAPRQGDHDERDAGQQGGPPSRSATATARRRGRDQGP